MKTTRPGSRSQKTSTVLRRFRPRFSKRAGMGRTFLVPRTRRAAPLRRRERLCCSAALPSSAAEGAPSEDEEPGEPEPPAGDEPLGVEAKEPEVPPTVETADPAGVPPAPPGTAPDGALGRDGAGAEVVVGLVTVGTETDGGGGGTVAVVGGGGTVTVVGGGGTVTVVGNVVGTVVGTVVGSVGRVVGKVTADGPTSPRAVADHAPSDASTASVKAARERRTIRRTVISVIETTREAQARIRPAEATVSGASCIELHRCLSLAPGDAMAADDIPWQHLVERIKVGAVTPFLGAGISRPPLPNAQELAEELARRSKYPFVRRTDLMEVAQYMATTVDGTAPKLAVAGLFKQIVDPNFKDKSQPHTILASLPLPVYLTTNYDDYMEKALEEERRSPVHEVCRWNSELRQTRPSYLDENEPEVGKPVVFHIHGHIDDPDSFVLTEDDYLDFMVNVRRHEGGSGNVKGVALPAKVTELLTSTSLLFLGYGLRDWNLRVLLRALVQAADVSSRKVSVSVQIEPGDDLVDELGKPEAIKYLEKYFEGLKIRVFWGTAQEFLTELKSHWDSRPETSAPGVAA